MRGVVLVRIEHMSGDRHLFATQSDEKPPLDVEFALIRPGPGRHQVRPSTDSVQTGWLMGVG